MLKILPTLDANSIHAVVTDPPYNLDSIAKRFGSSTAAAVKPGKTGAYARSSKGFMGMRWDTDIAFQVETWAEVIRVMRPGAFMVAFASTRGYHRMTCAIEDAGFIIHPMIGWLFASGFPKATRFKLPDMEGFRYGLQALKPALEPICFAQKPMEGTGNENWTKWGCGGLNIEAARIEADGRPERTKLSGLPDVDGKKVYGSGLSPGSRATGMTDLGRWPANLAHDGSDEVMEAFAAFGERQGQQGRAKTDGTETGNKVFGALRNRTINPEPRRDTGTAARFFYCAKASKADRAGSGHPTVKPLALMDWLVKLITPPGGTILDPFAGSGATLCAADRLQFDAIGIEQSAEYVADIHRRLHLDAGMFAEVAI
jgi:site-specific DNA-methyltransferase (adenine-specific)